MRSFILPAFLFLFFSSCSKYTYLKVSSADTESKNTNEFIMENDTIKITYRFFGYYGPVQLSVFNKSTKGIQVDWSKSFLIRGTASEVFYMPAGKINGELQKGGRYSSTDILNASFTQNAALEFIPPGTHVIGTWMQIIRGNDIKTDSPIMQKKKITIGGFHRKANWVSFSNENSPFSFRVYLTLVVPGTETELIVVDKSFYISELTATKIIPEDIKSEKSGEGMIILKQPTTAGSIFRAIGGLIVIVALIAAAASGN